MKNNGDQQNSLENKENYKSCRRFSRENEIEGNVEALFKKHFGLSSPANVNQKMNEKKYFGKNKLCFF